MICVVLSNASTCDNLQYLTLNSYLTSTLFKINYQLLEDRF